MTFALTCSKTHEMKFALRSHKLPNDADWAASLRSWACAFTCAETTNAAAFHTSMSRRSREAIVGGKFAAGDDDDAKEYDLSVVQQRCARCGTLLCGYVSEQ